jgi:hypothetical protein
VRRDLETIVRGVTILDQQESAVHAPNRRNVEAAMLCRCQNAKANKPCTIFANRPSNFNDFLEVRHLSTGPHFIVLVNPNFHSRIPRKLAKSEFLAFIMVASLRGEWAEVAETFISIRGRTARGLVSQES